jgi:hypothetical protein
VKGTWVIAEPFHLIRYVDEQTFRLNAPCYQLRAREFSFQVRPALDSRINELACMNTRRSPAVR